MPFQTNSNIADAEWLVIRRPSILNTKCMKINIEQLIIFDCFGVSRECEFVEVTKWNIENKMLLPSRAGKILENQH